MHLSDDGACAFQGRRSARNLADHAGSFGGGVEEEMKISARNQLRGRIVSVTKGRTTTHVRLEVGSAVVMAAITNEAVDDLALKPGQDAYAIIKASDVMIAIDH
jgi:molybdopterin-binding protein